MLCPKGVKRYLQGNHPDRLLDPLMRTASGFQPVGWDEALAFTARRLRELQERYGRDAVAVYGGASLTTEKSYLLAKFARVALGTRHIDYNGRLCMVSAGTVRTEVPTTVDFSLFKNFQIHEKFKLQFRANAYNLANTPVFGGPNTTSGVIGIGQVNDPRIVELALKLNF